VWANAGAHDSDVAAVLESAGVLLSDGSEQRLALPDLRLGYRQSRFKEAPGELVLSATFRLEPASADHIKARLDEIRRWRQAHQPLGLPSAGSVFRNPEDRSAGALIDEAGLKGLSLGGASVSEKHANFIVNAGRGTAADVRLLGEQVQAEIRRRFDVALEFEIVFLGDWNGWTARRGFE
jgi:UDP-N-acetylmuramate dehydrogenase